MFSFEKTLRLFLRYMYVSLAIIKTHVYFFLIRNAKHVCFSVECASEFSPFVTVAKAIIDPRFYFEERFKLQIIELRVNANYFFPK